eukprot:352598-Chlamydomonas_euryale.AAC.5
MGVRHAGASTGLLSVQAAHGMAFQKVSQLLVLVHKITVAASGDVYAELMDTSGCIGAAVCKTVVKQHPEFAPGSAMILTNVSKHTLRMPRVAGYPLWQSMPEPAACQHVQISVIAHNRLPCILCITCPNIVQVFPLVVRESLRAAKQLVQPTICCVPDITSVDQHSRSRASIVNTKISNAADIILQQLGPPSEQPSATRSCLLKPSACTATGQAAAEMCTEPALAIAISSAVEPQCMTTIRLAECDDGFDPEDGQVTAGLAPNGRDDPSEDLEVEAEAPSFEFMSTDAVSNGRVDQNIPQQLTTHNPSQHLPSSALCPQKSRLRQLLLNQDDNIELEE